MNQDLNKNVIQEKVHIQQRTGNNREKSLLQMQLNYT